jgi:hypothetical protein
MTLDFISNKSPCEIMIIASLLTSIEPVFLSIPRIFRSSYFSNSQYFSFFNKHCRIVQCSFPILYYCSIYKCIITGSGNRYYINRERMFALIQFSDRKAVLKMQAKV